MGALARALLLPLLAQWLLRAAPELAPAPFTLPLRVATATNRAAAPTSGPGTPAERRADGLALALEPALESAAGSANFLAMVDNLQGDSGRGYYLEMLIGTPPQKLFELVGGRGPYGEASTRLSIAPKQQLSPQRRAGNAEGLGWAGERGRWLLGRGGLRPPPWAHGGVCASV
ncbi:Beta-secretase 2 [Saguinus oedipus]|uniref:Beta-secretase 2 n=1 Tax=Saguinus oedipus TaxID=9490 RepID=A0ABQ9TYV6_SAGOE|nr:Beta-secretase 2 [Saguinus oedipus]